MARNSDTMKILTVSGLSHSFGGLKAVSRFDLTIEPESIWGIIGPNGAGKTTVFNLITGVYRPDEGSVRLGTEELTGLPSHAIVAKGISRTFQNIRLFKSMTVLDNIITAGYCRLGYSLFSAIARTPRFQSAEARIRSDAMDILETFGIADRSNDPAAGLPYGLQRNVELARALISKPAVRLLDEPGAGMNPAELDALAQRILWIRKTFSVAVVLIEHRMQLVMKVCDQVRVLNFGETLFTGKPGQLAGNEAVVKAYFGEDHAAACN